MYNLTTKLEASQIHIQLVESLIINVMLSLEADERLAPAEKIL